ncbi:MAG: hypothetical protein BWY94_02411 [Actinobacteria bacterium ADurb.BinA094]|nr:MAG: hypothetical protein BWY94_02411 [Actinobacteria bacterium ADurb.BinA094]
MIERSQMLATIGASRERRRALVVVPSVITMRAARHYLEDHGADLEYVRFVLPDELHVVRGKTFAAVAVDSYARMQAREMGRADEFKDLITSVSQGAGDG